MRIRVFRDKSRRSKFLQSVLLIVGIFAGAVPSAGAQGTSTVPNKYIVVLEGEPASASFLRAKESKAATDPAAAARAQAAALNLQQDTFAAQLTVLGAKEVARYSRLLNAV